MQLATEDRLLEEIKRARMDRDDAQARYDVALKKALKIGVSTWRISAHAGVSYDAIRMYARRKGWR